MIRAREKRLDSGVREDGERVSECRRCGDRTPPPGLSGVQDRGATSLPRCSRFAGAKRRGKSRRGGGCEGIEGTRAQRYASSLASRLRALLQSPCEETRRSGTTFSPVDVAPCGRDPSSVEAGDGGETGLPSKEDRARATASTSAQDWKGTTSRRRGFGFLTRRARSRSAVPSDKPARGPGRADFTGLMLPGAPEPGPHAGAAWVTPAGTEVHWMRYPPTAPDRAFAPLRTAENGQARLMDRARRGASLGGVGVARSCEMYADSDLDLLGSLRSAA